MGNLKCTTLNATTEQIATIMGMNGPGNIWYVDYRNGNDNDSGDSWERAFKTYSRAITAAVTNNNDIILIDGDSTVAETAMVTLSKNRVHTIGINGMRHYGQGAKISLGVTTAATDIATFKNTGVRNTFTGIKFINNNTVDEGLYCVVEAGEYGTYRYCEFYKSTDMDVTGAAELVMNGDSAQLYNCTIGSLATARSGAVIRPNVLMTKGIISGKVARDVYFENCKFWINASNAANRFIYGANATDVERIMELKECSFINNGASSATPGQNVAFGSALTVGSVLLNDCISVNAATAMSTTTGVFVSGAVPAADTSGIALQAT